MRNQLIGLRESAAKENDPEKRQELLNFVVVGGGTTDVEVIGMLAEDVKIHPAQALRIIFRSGDRNK